jgi:nucleotide-binding universal stress UspA family protein
MVPPREQRDHERMNPVDYSDENPVLLCYDRSEDAKHAIQSAGSLLAGRRALVLTVWQPAAGLYSIAWLGDTSGTVNFAELDRTAAETGGHIANDGVRIAERAGLQAEPMAVKATGPVWKTIIEVADRHNAAAIVIGSRGLTGLRSLLGSVSSAVVHHADRPTLVVHRPSHDTTHRHGSRPAVSMSRSGASRPLDGPCPRRGEVAASEHLRSWSGSARRGGRQSRDAP